MLAKNIWKNMEASQNILLKLHGKTINIVLIILTANLGMNIH
jgi:hypothetical protein